MTMINAPIDYMGQMMNEFLNTQPSGVMGTHNKGTAYYKRYLYHLVFSVFKFKIPDEWKLNYFRFWLFRFGSIAIVYTEEYGWVCSPYGIVELGFYYNPSKIIINNPHLKNSKVGVIGVNAGVVHLFDDFYGIDDLVSHYATKLASCDKSIDINLMNCNVALIGKAKNKKQADTIKEAYKKASSGEPLVVVGNDVFSDDNLTTMVNGIKNNLIANDVLTAKRSIINEFLTTIGIPNSNTDKKERLVSDEVNSNNQECTATVEVIYDNIKKSFDEINKISGLNLGVELRFDNCNKEESGVLING